MRINKFKDFVERVGWTAIQAAAGAALVALTDPAVDWGTAAKLIGITAAVAALKVVTAQQVGDTGNGDAIPGGVEK